jgi:hypothetical protein
VPVVEPVVTAEKLRQLLDEGHESATLDYKSACDLNDKHDCVELAKDVGAMQVVGGFLVIGADDHGTPTGMLTEPSAKLLDEATLRAKLRSYLSEPFDIRSQVHDIDGTHVGVIYVGPNPKGFAVFKTDGQYTDAQGRQQTPFRKGDVFVRHGSASERWQQQDIDPIIEKIVATRKEQWRKEFTADLGPLIEEGRLGREVARAPASALTWELDEETFLSAVIEQLRSGDDIPLRLLLDRMAGDAAELLNRPNGVADLGVLLDRLACLIAVMLRLERPEEFHRALEVMVAIYDIGFDPQGMDRRDLPIPAPKLWLMVIERVYALGALAVRRQQWEAVHDLALQRGHGYEFRAERFAYTSWLRHAVTMAARTNLFRDENNAELSLLALALSHVREEACLRGSLPADDERLLNSLTQFDVLAALVAIGDARAADSHYFYTSFARFYSHRSEPAIVKLLENEEARAALFPLNDDELATALRAIDRLAMSEGVRFSGWHGFTNPQILEFLKAHPPLAQQP